MGNPYYDQKHAAYGDDGSDIGTVPDDVVFSSCDITSEERDKLEKFHIRLNVANTGSKSANISWQLHYNTTPSLSGTTQVLPAADSRAVQLVASDDTDIVGSENTTTAKCGATGTWQNGEYQDNTSEDTDKIELAINYYTEFQFCIQFTSSATYNQTYYFMLAAADTIINAATVYGQVLCKSSFTLYQEKIDGLIANTKLSGALIREMLYKRREEGEM